MDAGEAGPARARVGVDVVGARGPVLAGGAQALVDFQGTAVPHETRQAAAVEGVDLVGAGSPVETGIWWSQRGFLGLDTLQSFHWTLWKVLLWCGRSLGKQSLMSVSQVLPV